MSELVQEVSSIGGSSRSQGNAAASRPIIEQSVGSGGTSVVEGSSKPVIEQTVARGSGPMLSATTREMLENLDKHGSVRAPAADPNVPAANEEPKAAPAAAPAKEPTKEPETKPAESAESAKPEPNDEHRVANERLAARNRELLSELETLRKSGSQREPEPRFKALAEAERGYLDDSTGALRKFIAAAIGVDDPAHKDVDAELAGLYQDLTAKELGIELDESKRALREVTRTRQLRARDQREARTQQEKPAAAPATAQTDNAEHVALIGGKLPTIGAKYPLTMALAERMHGAKPEALLLRVIHEGFATGEFDPSSSDDLLIEQALKKTETHYQALADDIGKARPSNSTATPTTADATANQEKAQPQAGRSITNASASVAPATPPAKQPETTTKTEPVYRTEHERRMAIARKHFGEPS